MRTLRSVIPSVGLLILAAVLSSCNDGPATTRLTSADSGRTIAYRYRAAAEGQAKVTLNYWRSFESVPPLRVFDITVNVRR